MNDLLNKDEAYPLINWIAQLYRMMYIKLCGSGVHYDLFVFVGAAITYIQHFYC